MSDKNVVALPKGVKWVELDIFGDARGDLMVVEGSRSVPFDIKRVYSIFHTTYHMVRGCHAHINMQQLIMNVTGSYTLTLDDGHKSISVNFTKPGTGVLIQSLVWRELTQFSPGSVINCFTDKYYADSEYISNYEDFLALARNS